MFDSSSRLRARLWFARHAHWIQRGGGLAQALILSSSGEQGRGARVRAGLGMGMAALDAVAEALGRSAYDVVKDWAPLPDQWDLRDLIEHALGPPPAEDGVCEGQQHVIAGTMVLRTQSTTFVDGDTAPVLEALAARVWSRVGGQLELVSSSRAAERCDVRALARPPRSTAQGADLVARLRPYLNAGRSPSALLIGEPGCGKTTAAVEASAVLAAERTLFVSVSELASIPTARLRVAVQFLRPGALVVDDLDRYPNPGVLLDMFDEAARFARMRIATVNRPRELGAALLRPGRFDLHVRSADPEVAATRLVDARACLAPIADALPAEIAAEAEAWPIAYVVALVDAVVVEGAARLEMHVCDLRRRLQEQREMGPEVQRRGAVQRGVSQIHDPGVIAADRCYSSGLWRRWPFRRP